MAAGIKVYNADGSLQFDTTNRLFRLLTIADIGSTNSGSTTVATQGTVNVVAQPGDNAGAGEPTVSVSGGTVSWNYNGAATRRPYNLVIGEF